MLRDRLKEAKGIGTPATRAEIIKSLKAQNLLAALGKLVVPTASGLRLYELLAKAAPSLVDPGTTAQWEMRLDEVVLGSNNFRAVIDGIASSAADLISRLTQQTGVKVDLAPASQRQRAGRSRRSPASPTATSRRRSRGPAREQVSEIPIPGGLGSEPAEQIPSGVARPQPVRGNARKPTPRMLAFARALAKKNSIPLPQACEQSFDHCRAFIEQHADDNGFKVRNREP
jgi:DNA topoisomerase-3